MRYVATALSIGIAAVLVPAATAGASPVSIGSVALSPATSTGESGARSAPYAPSVVPDLSTRTVKVSSADYVQHVPTHDRVVFLTVDDGVFKDATFLALVRRTHLPVTVFLTNRMAHGAAAAAYFRSLQSAGAMIEDHTLSHPSLTHVASPELTQQVCGAATADRRLFGTRPTLMRPPYGDVNAKVVAVAHSCGLRVIGWDAVMPQKGSLQTWNSSTVLHPGDIVLMHFLPGLTAQVERLARLVKRQHLRFALLERYV